MIRYDFTIPRPPSVNRTHRIVRNTKTGKPTIARSGQYSAWRDEAAWTLRANKIIPRQMIEGFFAIYIRCRTVGDIDNLIKPVLDLCQAQGFIRNDKNQRHIEVDWIEDIPENEMVVSLEEL